MSAGPRQHRDQVRSIIARRHPGARLLDISRHGPKWWAEFRLSTGLVRMRSFGIQHCGSFRFMGRTLGRRP